MKIALINSSPKTGASASGMLLDRMKAFLEGWEDIETGVHKRQLSQEDMDALSAADVWVFSMPLYVDGVPSHLLSCLEQIEKIFPADTGRKICAIVNCGFFEGIQAEYALRIMRNWAAACGFTWSGGIGVGGGGGLAMMPQTKPGTGPSVHIDNALSRLSKALLRGEVMEDQYVSVAFPRFLYKAGAQMGWRYAVKANGLKRSDLSRCPEIEQQPNNKTEK